MAQHRSVITKRFLAVSSILVVGVAALAILSAVRPPTPVETPSATAGDRPPPADPVPWAEVDWRRIERPFVAGPIPERIDGLVRRGSTLLGFGRASTPDRNQFNDMGAVFLSTDGERWQTILIPASEIRVAAAGDSGFVLLGETCCPLGKTEPAIWYSANGVTWEPIRLPDRMAFFQAARATDALGTGFVAAGQSVAPGQTNGRAAMWVSPEGRSWFEVDPAQAQFGAGGVGDVVRAGATLLAVGWVDDGATYDGAVWESQDGVAWQRLQPDPALIGPMDTQLGRVYPFAGGLLAIGNEGPHDERVRCEQAAGEIASLVFAGQPGTAFVCVWGVETHWFSRDGRSWQRLPPVAPLPGGPPLPGPRPIEFRLIAAGGPGLVDVAEDDRHGLALWVSSDGQLWNALSSDIAFRAGQDGVRGMVVMGRRIVAVGETWDLDSQAPASPAVWVGSIP